MRALLEEKIDKWKRGADLLSFDDLLSQTAQAVTSEGEGGVALRKSLGDAFDAAMIDEFQDTDPVQFKIFRELFGKEKKHWLYLIGDPKQSIYRLRAIWASFDFLKKTNAVKFSLDTNFGPSRLWSERWALSFPSPKIHFCMTIFLLRKSNRAIRGHGPGKGL